MPVAQKRLSLDGVTALNLYAAARHADAQFEAFLRSKFKDPDREFFQRFRDEISVVNIKHPLGPSAAQRTISPSDEKLVPIIREQIDAGFNCTEMAHFLNIDGHRTSNGRNWRASLVSKLIDRLTEAGYLEDDGGDE